MKKALTIAVLVVIAGAANKYLVRRFLPGTILPR